LRRSFATNTVEERYYEVESWNSFKRFLNAPIALWVWHNRRQISPLQMILTFEHEQSQQLVI
jgi:hypothetical protein